MKKIIVLSLSFCLLLSFSAIAQEQATPPSARSVNAVKSVAKKETFRVYGNCSMCERAIENSTKAQDGVIKADWDKKTDQFTVTFNPTIITLDRIKQQLADIGYDTDTHRAKEEVYNALPGCCQYDRPEKL